MKTFLLAPGCVMGVELFSQSPCPEYVSVMPLHDGCAEELAKDAADLGNTE